ncbi:MAG: ATP-dependent helicase, partial [Bacillota bacterium]
RLRILEEEQQLQLIRRIMREIGLNTDDETVQEALAELSRMRASTADPAAFRPRGIGLADFRQLWQSYTLAKERLGTLDFDDLLHEALAQLQGRPDLLEAYRERYRHILVDEFQDTNAVQWTIIRLLAEPRRNLCVVGDDDQAIYGWRGASPEFLLAFPKTYPEAVRVTLDLNHRCPPPVVEAANRLAAANRRRFGKVIRPLPGRSGPSVELLAPADSLQEAEAVARLIKGAGAPLSDWAVIYRTNQQAHAIAQVLAREGIPYRALGGLPNLYRRWPVQDVLAYLRAAVGEPFAIEPVLNRPTRYLSRAVVQEARRIAESAGLDLLSAIPQTGMLRSWQLRPVEELLDQLYALRRMQAPDAIGYVRTIIGYDDYIKEYCEREGGSPDEMLGLLSEVERTSPRLMLTAFLAQVDSFSSEAGRRPAEGEEAVTLATCHKAKGLEFRRVVVVGAIDKLLPHRGSDDIEEERRLMYVAMTRAGERLWLSAPRAYAGREAQPSPFLEEALGPLAPAAD